MFEGGFSQLGMTQGFGGGAATQADDAAKKARPDEKQQVLAVTVRAVEKAIAASGNASGDGLTFYGAGGCEPSQLILVGAVEKLSKQAASMEMTINDGTGRIKARYFLNDAEGAALAESVCEGTYVNVVGSVRTSPEVHLGLIALRSVRSADEISYHSIECAHAALRIRRGPEAIAPMAAQSTAQPTMTQQQAQTPSPLKTAPPAVISAVPAAPIDAAALQTAVLEVVKTQGEAAGEAGVGVDSIVAAMAKTAVKASQDDIRKVLASLVENADCYTTIDDDHVLAI